MFGLEEVSRLTPPAGQAVRPPPAAGRPGKVTASCAALIMGPSCLSESLPLPQPAGPCDDRPGLGEPHRPTDDSEDWSSTSLPAPAPPRTGASGWSRRRVTSLTGSESLRLLVLPVCQCDGWHCTAVQQ